MQGDVQIVRRQDDTQLAQVDYAYEPETPSNPLQTAHRLLQGRYPLVVVLALLGGIIAAAITYKVVPNSYSSTGTIRVLPVIAPLINKDPGEDVPHFTDFVNLQVKLLTSEKVLDDAANDPDWRLIAGTDNADVMKMRLKVAGDGETIDVAYSDPNLNKPDKAVRAIIHAYLNLYGDKSEQAGKKTQRDTLMEMQTKLNQQTLDLTEKMREIEKPWGGLNLDFLVQKKQQEVSDLENQIRSIQIKLATDESMGTTRPSTVPPEIWGQYDREMNELLQMRREKELELAKLRDSGLGENNPSVHLQVSELTDLKEKIEDRRIWLEQNVQIPDDAKTLRVQLTTLQTYLSEATNGTRGLNKLSDAAMAMKQVNDEINATKVRLDEVKQTLEQLQIETAGHIDAISYGDRTKLEIDKRRVAAIAGGVGGAFLVVACFLLFGLANRRMQRIADIQPEGPMNRGLRLLGAVPMLSADASMGDNTPAAQAVHRIRTRLQIEAASSDRRVITVTSPDAGNGKTSVTTALGMSFASSGSRVLLIDCDMVGAGLTARLNGRVRRNIVDVLRSQTHVTEEQLAQAARVANKSSDRFLQALLDFGYLDADTIKRAIATHKESNLGLLDAINGEPLDQCVAATRWPRLFVLPRGAASGADAAQLSPLALRRLFQQARSSFDVVLVDSGPLFGSIEATLAASESDGTVLVVSRGESAAAVQAAVNDLKGMNCKVMGVVFNRAKSRDVASYGYSKSRMRQHSAALLSDGAGVSAGPISAGPANGQGRPEAAQKLA